MQYLIICLGVIMICSSLGSIFPFIYNKEINYKLNQFIGGFASGVMLAAAIWSLLVPAFEMDKSGIMVIVSFIIGVLIIILIDIITIKSHNESDYVNKIYFVVTAHNVPEGMIVGLAVAIGMTEQNFENAILIAIAIGLQNIPESIALSSMLYSKNKNKFRSFFYSFLSGAVEPLFGIIAFLLVGYLENMIAMFLGMAGGCMIYVVLSEMIPNTIEEEVLEGKIGIIVGFMIMMIMDIFL
ncbi:MAG: ZIP family metal transporter [Bacilli bacterium]|nr:ZIP family metal transporter [Bacilli bacterium]